MLLIQDICDGLRFLETAPPCRTAYLNSGVVFGVGRLVVCKSAVLAYLVLPVDHILTHVALKSTRAVYGFDVAL